MNMQVKYNDSEAMHPIDDYQFIDLSRVRLIGKNIPTSTAGFDVYSDEGYQLYLNSQHTVIYDVTEDYVDYSSDTNIRYVYYMFDPETRYVKGYSITDANNNKEELDHGVFVKSGNTKDVVEFTPDIKFFDENNFPNYKVNEEGEMIETPQEEKDKMMEAKIEAEYQQSKLSKLNEISGACHKAITEGVTYNGATYSYTLEDQNNLTSAVELANKTGLEVPYHADGQPCQLYAVEDIVNIYVINQTNLTHHNTYFNQLKLFTETLTTKEEVEAVVYGQELTGEYLEIYNTIMMQSKKIIAAYLSVEEEVVESILGDTPALANI